MRSEFQCAWGDYVVKWIGPCCAAKEIGKILHWLQEPMCRICILQEQERIQFVDERRSCDFTQGRKETIVNLLWKLNISCAREPPPEGNWQCRMRVGARWRKFGQVSNLLWLSPEMIFEILPPPIWKRERSFGANRQTLGRPKCQGGARRGAEREYKAGNKVWKRIKTEIYSASYIQDCNMTINYPRCAAGRPIDTKACKVTSKVLCLRLFNSDWKTKDTVGRVLGVNLALFFCICSWFITTVQRKMWKDGKQIAFTRALLALREVCPRLTITSASEEAVSFRWLFSETIATPSSRSGTIEHLAPTKRFRRTRDGHVTNSLKQISCNACKRRKFC